MTKKISASIFVLVFAILACGIPVQQVVVVVTATPEELHPTATLYPTTIPTRAPQPTPVPTQKLVSLFDVEQALIADGWKRAPYYYSDTSQQAYAWTKESVYKRIYTFEDGRVRIEVLNTHTRMDDMEARFKFLDTIFPPNFLAQLRQQNQVYDKSIGMSVSGKSDWIWYNPAGAEWNEYVATFNSSSVTIDPYQVTFQLYLWHLTCPSPYGCYMNDFPGQDWTGETSFTWYTIMIQLPNNGGTSGRT